MAITLRQHLSKLKYLENALAEAINDLRKRAHNRIIYNVDFGLICPILFKRPSPGSRNFLFTTKDSMVRVLETSSQQNIFTLTISGPTLLEFFDQMNHLMESLKTRLPRVIDSYLKNRSIDDALVTSDRIKSDLSIFSKKGYDDIILGPVNRLISYLDSSAIIGVGDIVGNELSIDKNKLNNKFRELMGKQEKYRLPKESERGREDSIFHYEMDAMNVCLSLASAENPDNHVYFVTPTRFNLKECIIGGEAYGRRDRVPLFMQNLERLKSFGSIDNEEEYLQEALRNSSELYKKLSTYDSMDSIPPYFELKLGNFYELYVGPLANPKTSKTGFDESLHSKEIHEVLSDKKKIHDVLEEAVEDIRTGAKLLELHASSFDISYIEEFDLQNDPILQKIKDNLGIL